MKAMAAITDGRRSAHAAMPCWKPRPPESFSKTMAETFMHQ